jgi:hypothetical protein
MGWACSSVGDKSTVLYAEFLWGKPFWERPHGRPKSEDTIKMDFREAGCEAAMWMELAHDSVQ